MSLAPNEILVMPVSQLGGLDKVFPAPMPFFKKKEFRRYKDYGPAAVEWWDGHTFSRGSTITGSTMNRGIDPSQRRPTDYHIENGKIFSDTQFYQSEFSVKKQRHRKSVAIDADDFVEVAGFFRTYLTVWNYLVTLDQQGTKLHMALLQTDSTMARHFAESPFYAKKALREYMTRRSMASSPLRHKQLSRLNSIPLDRNDIGLKAPIQSYLDTIGGDLRRLISGRVVRKSDKRYLVSFTFTVPDVIREVDNDKNNPSINFCRDPRLVDIGISFSKKGMSLVVQNAFEDREFFCVKPNVLKDTAKFLNKFLSNLKGKVRCIGMDESYPITGPLLEVRKGLARRCKALEAVGATEFYIPPKLISLGEQYPSGTPFYDKNRLKVWERKLISQHEDYAMIQGLTGAPCLIKVSDGKLVTSKGTEVFPETMANHALLLALAKLDMWHGAISQDSGTCRTVRKGLDRRKEKQLQMTSVMR